MSVKPPLSFVSMSSSRSVVIALLLLFGRLAYRR
jgi:hypothetical protein